MGVGDIFSCPTMPEGNLIRGLSPSAEGFCLMCEGTEWMWQRFGGYNEPTCLESSEWLPWSGPLDSGTEFRQIILSPFIASLWRLLVFQAQLTVLILAQICTDIFSLSICTCILKSSFIFIKEMSLNIKNIQLFIPQTSHYWCECSLCEISAFFILLFFNFDHLTALSRIFLFCMAVSQGCFGVCSPVCSAHCQNPDSCCLTS